MSFATNASEKHSAEVQFGSRASRENKATLIMEDFFDQLELPFLSVRKTKLKKFCILLNEPKVEENEDKKYKPCSLATELLPELLEAKGNDDEDLVQMIGDILQSKIKLHAEVDKVPILKPDDIIENNVPTLVPVMYRIATEHFVQKNESVFKIIECRNATKLISDWKPSLPDRLISLGHQVIVVQLETSFVPFTDFSYAILRQLDCDWKTRLPRSFFFPDDVCKVEATPDRDLCVVSPSMPDGDLEINKKMGLLNYELLLMIKCSCMSAMKNYLLKRDLRVGKFSDTLDGVSALRQLYRKLQERLNSGEAVELGSSSLEDLRSLVKQSIGGADVLAAQTWIEYGKRIGLDIPASASSSATSITSARRIIREGESDSGSSGEEEDEKDEDGESDPEGGGDCAYRKTNISYNVATSSSSGLDVDDGKGCQKENKMTSNNNDTFSSSEVDDDLCNGCKVGLLHGNGFNGILKGERRGSNDNDDVRDDNAFNLFRADKESSMNSATVMNNSQEDEDDEENEGLKLEDFTDFRDSLVKMHEKRKLAGCEEDDDGDDDEEGDYNKFLAHEFTADSILQILQLPNKAL